MKRDLQTTLFWGLAALAIANFISGIFNSVLVKLGVREIPPITFTMFRFLIASLAILPFYLRQSSRKPLRKHMWIILAQSVFFAANVGIFSIAIQFTSAIMSQIIYIFVPVVVGIISYFVFKEKFTKHKIIGSLVALLGVLFLIEQSIVKADILSFGTLHGNLLILCGVFVYSGYLLLSQKLTKIYSPITTTFSTFLITFILLMLVAPFELIDNPLQISKITFVGIGSLFGLAIFSSAIMYFLIQIGIKHAGAFTASLFQYMAPFFTAISAMAVLGEKLTLTIVLGGLLIMFGVFYATTYPYVKRGIRYMLK